jgi:hypothetical protein
MNPPAGLNKPLPASRIIKLTDLIGGSLIDSQAEDVEKTRRFGEEEEAITESDTESKGGDFRHKRDKSGGGSGMPIPRFVDCLEERFVNHHHLRRFTPIWKREPPPPTRSLQHPASKQEFVAITEGRSRLA